MLDSGVEIHLFGGELTQDAAPSANISGFSVTASKAGGISISWTIDGTMLTDEKVVVHVCETDANCASPVSDAGTLPKFLKHCSLDKTQFMVQHTMFLQQFVMAHCVAMKQQVL